MIKNLERSYSHVESGDMYDYAQKIRGAVSGLLFTLYVNQTVVDESMRKQLESLHTSGLSCSELHSSH